MKHPRIVSSRLVGLLLFLGTAGCQLEAIKPAPTQSKTIVPTGDPAVESPDEPPASQPNREVQLAANTLAAPVADTAAPLVAAQQPASAAAPPEPDPDLLAALRGRFRLPDHEDRRIDQHLDWYVRHPDYLERCLERAEPYLPWILDQLEAEDMPGEFALLPIVESAFNPFAYSHGRAAGLWQFIPATGKRFGLKQNWWYDGRRDWVAATEAALRYLQSHHERFDDDWLLALAAYNAGEGNVLKAQRRNRRRGRGLDFWSLDLPRETENYVPKVLALKRLFANPEEYGITLPSLPRENGLRSVDTGGQIDLSLAAELAGIPVEELYRLNPGFNRWATDPDGPHRLILPKPAADAFKTALAELPRSERVHWQRHRIQKGDTLIGLASRYHTTVELLKDVNQLHTHRIRAGDHLLIPTARDTLDAYSLSAGQRRLALRNRDRDGHKTIHRVSSGDTFWELARDYKVGVRQLAGWNGMAPTDMLRVGQELVIWTRQPTTTVNSSLARQRVRYRVRKGDSLSRISQRFKVSIRDLERWNDLDRDNYLQPGQVLTLYVDVTRQAERI